MLSFLRKLTTSRSKDGVADRAHYRRYQTGIEVFRPWEIDADIRKAHADLSSQQLTTLVSADRFASLKWAFQQTRHLDGEIWEAGVYRGGVANFFKNLNLGRSQKAIIRLFDSFEGLPNGTDGIDLHQKGDFADTSLAGVKLFLGAYDFLDFRAGWIPETFVGLEDCKIKLAHIDVDLYNPTRDSLYFIYPRMLPGGVIVIDDYGFISCPGVRKAVDEFFADKQETILYLPSGNAIVVKL